MMKNNNYGLLVTKVKPDSNAHRSGLLLDDVLISYNGRPLGSLDLKELCQSTASVTGGVELLVLRDKEEKLVSVNGGTLGVTVERLHPNSVDAGQRSFGTPVDNGQYCCSSCHQRFDVEKKLKRSFLGFGLVDCPGCQEPLHTPLKGSTVFIYWFLLSINILLVFAILGNGGYFIPNPIGLIVLVAISRALLKNSNLKRLHHVDPLSAS